MRTGKRSCLDYGGLTKTEFNHHLLAQPKMMTLNAECVARPGKALKMRCPLSLRWRKQVPLRHNAALQQLL